MDKGFTGGSDIAHQLGCPFQIPEGTGHAGVSHRGGQCERVAADVITGLRGVFERPYGEGVPQINEAGARAAGLPGNACRREHVMKRLRHHSPGEPAMTARDKEMGVGARRALALDTLAVKRASGRGMQGQEAAFLELGVPDEQAVLRHVREVEGQRFRNTHPGDRE